MRIIIGIDGGGSKTHARAVLQDGTVVADKLSGPSNYHDIGEYQVLLNLKHLISELLYQAEATEKDVECVSMGMAGAGRTGDIRVYESILEELKLGRLRLVHPDYLASLYSGSYDGQGIVLISGTGSICFGQKGNKKARCGGYGPLLSDEGSGYWIGRRGLEQLLKIHDGRAPRTEIVDAILMLAGFEELSDFVEHFFTRSSFQNMRTQIAGYAPAVFAAAREGDSFAAEIIQAAARLLAELALHVAKKTGYSGEENVKVVLTGGIFQNSNEVEMGVREHLKRELPHVEIIAPVLKPVDGNIIYAMHRLGQSVTSEIISNLRKR